MAFCQLRIGQLLENCIQFLFCLRIKPAFLRAICGVGIRDSVGMSERGRAEGTEGYRATTTIATASEHKSTLRMASG